MTQSYVQAHLDLLLLAVIQSEPGDSEAVMNELREQSDGRFAPSRRLVYGRLHYLERNHLISRSYDRPPRYVLTESGRRSLRGKRKEWDSFARVVHTMLG
jgi:PadR family transcriptional regulator, regulatory protein PadR